MTNGICKIRIPNTVSFSCDPHAEYFAALMSIATSSSVWRLKFWALKTRTTKWEECPCQRSKAPFSCASQNVTLSPGKHDRTPACDSWSHGSAYENVALWHERVISSSLISRAQLSHQDTTISWLTTCPIKFLNTLRTWQFSQKTWSANIWNPTFGLIFSQRAMPTLTEYDTKSSLPTLVQPKTMNMITRNLNHFLARSSK